jgi:RNA polymerase sigma-70 factor (ECF subfamily)
MDETRAEVRTISMEAGRATSPGADVGSLVAARLTTSYRLARAILLDDHEAEDAVQDAAMVAWRKQGSLRERDKFDAWFDRILVNVCRDRLRRRRRIREIPSMGMPESATPGSDPASGSPDDAIDRALEALDADHRIVVLLRFWQDRTVDDIAGRLGIPAGTVKSRLHHALRQVRARLEGTDGRA